MIPSNPGFSAPIQSPTFGQQTRPQALFAGETAEPGDIIELPETDQYIEKLYGEIFQGCDQLLGKSAIGRNIGLMRMPWYDVDAISQEHGIKDYTLSRFAEQGLLALKLTEVDYKAPEKNKVYIPEKLNWAIRPTKAGLARYAELKGKAALAAEIEAQDQLGENAGLTDEPEA